MPDSRTTQCSQTNKQNPLIRTPRSRFAITSSHFVIPGRDQRVRANGPRECGVAVSFRVTQVVDIVRGVHALIPKTIFAPQLRREITMV